MATVDPHRVPVNSVPEPPTFPAERLRRFAGYPYLVTRVVASLYHVIPLPADLPPVILRDLARVQLCANRLPTCLVLGEDLCLYLGVDETETVSQAIPSGGMVVTGRLRLPRPLRASQKLLDRLQQLATFCAAQPQPDCLFGDLTKGGRPATEAEREHLAGTTSDGVPIGLVRCPVCGDWSGECLDPNERFAGQVMRVHCRCQNWNRCARCGEPLYTRRLNANYYKPEDGQVWHVPGFCAFEHRCPERPAGNGEGNQ